jgi:hypothetical protein
MCVCEFVRACVYQCVGSVSECIVCACACKCSCARAQEETECRLHPPAVAGKVALLAEVTLLAAAVCLGLCSRFGCA